VFGTTHIPRLEDWPVMPVEHIGFMLMVPIAPFNVIYFFFFFGVTCQISSLILLSQDKKAFLFVVEMN